MNETDFGSAVGWHLVKDNCIWTSPVEMLKINKNGQLSNYC